MQWELRAYNTDRRYDNDVRYRAYTRSSKVAEQFRKIPKIQFTDSGHGIVFDSFPKMRGKLHLPEIRILAGYVHTEMAKIVKTEPKPPKRKPLGLELAEAVQTEIEKAIKQKYRPEINEAITKLAEEIVRKAGGK